MVDFFLLHFVLKYSLPSDGKETIPRLSGNDGGGEGEARIGKR